MKIPYKTKLFRLHLNPDWAILGIEISRCGLIIRISKIVISIFYREYSKEYII
jgi:hypothetical protein